MKRRRKDDLSSLFTKVGGKMAELELAFAAARLLEAGRAIKEFFPDNMVRLHTAQQASLITLIVDDRKVATFGPGHPLECADAVYGFVTHLSTRKPAEA